MPELVLEDGEQLTLPSGVIPHFGLEAGARLICEPADDGLRLHLARPDLRRAYVEVTSRCNLNCLMCVRQVWTDPSGEMPLETFRAVLEGLRGFPELQRLTFGGYGEPLLHPDFPEMLEAAATLKVPLTVTTNGLLLDEQMASYLLAAGVDWVFVSLDTVHAQAYKGARNADGLEQVLENARRLMRMAERRRWPPLNLGLEFVATRSNRKQLPRLREVARDLGASQVLVTNLLPHTPEMCDEILYDSDEPLGPPLNWPVPDRGSIVWGRIDLPNMKWGAWRRCRFIRERATVIGWDGGVSPCYALSHSYSYYVYGRRKQVGRYVLGNVCERSLADIWSSEEYVCFRARVREFRFESCVDCGMACDYAENNEDCAGNVPSCADCLWAQDIVRCP